jgi:hypothetical protein
MKHKGENTFELIELRRRITILDEMQENGPKGGEDDDKT